jgi:hypothetical protein
MPKPSRAAKKKAATAVLVMALALMLVTGTLAWRDYSQHKTNELWGHEPKHDATLVEDFEPNDDWTTGDGEVKKEIRVKNPGRAADGYAPVYVRIQLKEYMDFTPLVIEQTNERYMVDVSGAFVFYATQAAAQAAYPGHEVSYLTEATTGQSGWFVRTREDDPGGQYGKFVYTKFELGDKQYLVGDASLEDARNEPRDNHQKNPNKECEYPIHFWDVTYPGGFRASNLDESPARPGLETLAQPRADEYVRWLLGDRLVLLSEWDGTPADAWILDDVGNTGWVYWGTALAPEAETANFLDAVELRVKPQGDFYYAIHTDMQALSFDELFGDNPAWPDAPPLWVGSVNPGKVTGVTITPGLGSISSPGGGVALDRDGYELLTATVQGTGNVSQSVAWSIRENNTGGTATVSSSGLFHFAYAANPVGTSDYVVVRATSVSNPSVYAEIEIGVYWDHILEYLVVSPESATLVPGGSQQFSATNIFWSPTGDVTSLCTWQVVENRSLGTKISASGLLTVAPDETAPYLVIHVVSPMAGGRYIRVDILP